MKSDFFILIFFSFHKVLLGMVYLICHQGTVNLLLLQMLPEVKTPVIGEVTLKVSRPAELNDCFGLKKVVSFDNSLNF